MDVGALDECDLGFARAGETVVTGLPGRDAERGETSQVRVRRCARPSRGWLGAGTEPLRKNVPLMVPDSDPRQVDDIRAPVVRPVPGVAFGEAAQSPQGAVAGQRSVVGLLARHVSDDQVPEVTRSREVTEMYPGRSGRHAGEIRLLIWQAVP